MNPLAITLSLAAAASGAEHHVGPSHPLKSISSAARIALPGDTITVHAGIYREQVDPPHGGTDDAHRITYQAARGEKVVITGSDEAKGWVKVRGDVWKLSLPTKSFGNFNPYLDEIRGDWFDGKGRVHHTGCIYLNGDWMIEAASLEEVMQPAGQTPLWFASVEGNDGRYLMNLASLKPSAGPARSGAEPSFRYGGKPAPNPEGGACSGFIRNGSWLRFDDFDFGASSTSLVVRASAQGGVGCVAELRLGTPAGEWLGTCVVDGTGGWTNWRSFTAAIKPTRGKHTLCVIFKDPRLDAGNTTIHAQFSGIDPNTAAVEINRRQTVFYPSRNFTNYITVRGFILENAATNWAPPSSEQTAIIGTNWSKGWVIENNEIRHSKCSGVSLGKYGDGLDNTNDAGAADPYTRCLRDALKHGWDKATVGSHIVRNNHIHHCEQTGIVGSLGCAFSVVEGNEIHEIDARRMLTGAEQAGIKFHGFIDGIIRGNHIYRCGGISGVWLDWMGQNARITGNLMHDNTGGAGDIFCEMQHGPLLIDNNFLLSAGKTILINATNLSLAHNLLAAACRQQLGDTRMTPFHPPHSTAIAGLEQTRDGGLHRLCNNLCTGGWNGQVFNAPCQPCIAVGNVYVNGAQPSQFDADSLVRNDFDPGAKILRKANGWHLTLATDHAWKSVAKRTVVSTATLGKSSVSGAAVENPDGSPLAIDTDYFGKPRDRDNPFPGPVETPVSGEIKVWPKP